MTSRLGRAGLSAVSSTHVSGGYSPSQSSSAISYDALSGLVANKTSSSPLRSVKATIYEDDDDNDGYSIEPSVELWNSIDFNQSKLSKETTSSKTKRVSKYSESCESLMSSNLSFGEAASSSVNSSITYSDLTYSSPGKFNTVNPKQATTPPSFKVATSDYPIIAGSNAAASRASVQVEQLKKTLLQLEAQKIEAEDRRKQAELDKEKVEASANEALARQKEELMLMMESIQREKKELELRQQLIQAEKEKERERLSAKSEKERQELLHMLESMKAQNEMLALKVRETQAEAKFEIEKERGERMHAIAHIESINQTLLASQKEAEFKLSSEKEELRMVLRTMESEKEELFHRIQMTEERAAQDANTFTKKHHEYELLLAKVEADKLDLKSRVAENEESALVASVSTKMTDELAKERQELQTLLVKMEEEKITLSKTLEYTEKQARQHAEALAQQLEDERINLKKNMERMEQEKLQLATHLADTERNAQKRIYELQSRLEKEKLDLRDLLETMESEKANLSQKLLENENEMRNVSSSTTSSLSALQVEREKLLASLECTACEREELHQKLKQVEKTALDREEELKDKLGKEREELKETVSRMKHELEMERKMKAVLDTTPITPTGVVPVSVIASIAVPMSRIMSKGSLLPRTMKSIPEVSETEQSIFDLDDDDASVMSNKSIRTEFTASMAPVSTPNDTEGSERVSVAVPPVKESSHINTITTLETAAAPDTNTVTSKKNQSTTSFSTLPAPHAAAASGDVSKLKLLSKLEQTLLCSFDGSHRSPLFYAAAYGQDEALQVILSSHNELVREKDVHGDTPIHAATSAGNAECLEMMITSCSGETVEVIVSARNNSQMTPAHLAKNVECLNVLYKYGADMSTSDASGRSPLFVACAMNRVACAEYLINCLDETDSSIMTQDKRGDTPLHAAACNGSVDCLLLLLQYGIDPRVANHKGLKAIDLAIKNKQQKCREVLAEYHLHYSTSSDFDSVLFLATLKGHQQIKESAVSGSQKDEVLKKVQSMFSLKTNNSLRLVKWGDWLAYEDQVTNKIYWYNHNLGVGQYEKPDEVARLQAGGGSPSSVDMDCNEGKSTPLTSKFSMRLKRVGDWVKYKTETGQNFYYNEKNGEFQWENPQEFYVSPDGDETNNRQIKREDSGVWKVYKDPETGNVFWYNKITQVSQLECPPDVLPSNNGMVNARPFHGGSPVKEDYDNAMVVTDENDLGI